MPADIDAAAPDAEAGGLIILQFEIPLETVYHTIDFARRHGIRCIVNPAPAVPADAALLRGADYIIPNETEAELICGRPARTVDDAKACAEVLLARGFGKVLITLGDRGPVLADARGHVHIAPVPVTAIDTTGAGDAFIGSFAVFLAEGVPEREAAARASLYAALSTTGVGAQKSFPGREQFDAAWAARAR